MKANEHENCLFAFHISNMVLNIFREQLENRVNLSENKRLLPNNSKHIGYYYRMNNEIKTVFARKNY